MEFARRFWVLLIVVLALAFVAGCTGQGQSGTSSTGASTGGGSTGGGYGGVKGYVSIGPTTPVQRAGESDRAPYSAVLKVVTVPDGKVVVEIKSGTDGRFQLRLPAGTYRLDPKQGNPYPIASPVQFTVVKDKYTEVTVNYDSGIR